eukprot:TRINITY_DN1338_c0_g1_i1.p1 TRINITY_DN1338_c0_g1~~TRINITY_DN1338_c0_g1_i1.p1  ORF type:complete len:732 (-),score=134.49 TRINITY_DN1338_c0_g1_i1:1079-3250(-)
MELQSYTAVGRSHFTCASQVHESFSPESTRAGLIISSPPQEKDSAVFSADHITVNNECSCLQHTESATHLASLGTSLSLAVQCASTEGNNIRQLSEDRSQRKEDAVPEELANLPLLHDDLPASLHDLCTGDSNESSLPTIQHDVHDSSLTFGSINNSGSREIPQASSLRDVSKAGMFARSCSSSSGWDSTGSSEDSSSLPEDAENLDAGAAYAKSGNGCSCDHSRKVKDLQRVVDTLSADVKFRQSETLSLRSSLEAYERETKNLKKTLATFSEERDELKLLLSRATREQARLTKALTLTCAQLDHTRDDAKDAQHALDSLRPSFAELNRERNKLAEAEEAQRRECENLRGALERAKGSRTWSGELASPQNAGSRRQHKAIEDIAVQFEHCLQEREGMRDDFALEREEMMYTIQLLSESCQEMREKLEAKEKKESSELESAPTAMTVKTKMVEATRLTERSTETSRVSIEKSDTWKPNDDDASSRANEVDAISDGSLNTAALNLSPLSLCIDSVPEAPRLLSLINSRAGFQNSVIIDAAQTSVSTEPLAEGPEPGMAGLEIEATRIEARLQEWVERIAAGSILEEDEEGEEEEEEEKEDKIKEGTEVEIEEDEEEVRGKGKEEDSREDEKEGREDEDERKAPGNEREDEEKTCDKGLSLVLPDICGITEASAPERKITGIPGLFKRGATAVLASLSRAEKSGGKTRGRSSFSAEGKLAIGSYS